MLQLGFLQLIWNAIRSVPFILADLLVAAFNGFIVAIAALAAGLFALLPGFPEAPDEPPGGILGVIAWVAPIGPMLAIFAGLVTAYLVFLAVRIALNWVKAL